MEDSRTGKRRTVNAGAMMVLIGAAPRTDWLEGAVALDADGPHRSGSGTQRV